MNHLKLCCLASILCLLALAHAASAETFGVKDATKHGLISFHKLTVKLTPATHVIEAVDELTLRGSGERTLTFALNKAMEVSAAGKQGNPLELRPVAVEGLPDHLEAYSLTVATGVSMLSLAYKGTIYDPIQAETSLAHLRGGSTTGIIGNEGIYLDAGSGWYPAEELMLAGFELHASSPEPMLLVAQGDLLARESSNGMNYSRWRSDVPQDGLTLVGGEYSVQSRKVGRVTLSTYLFAKHEQFAEKLLDATERYLKFYTNLLGEFPSNRFDVVENFFQTGYGMPGYTLLGDAVLDMLGRGGYDVTGPSGIGHELMHNWWGNYVFFDHNRGNWCEGLTTYLTNYYWLEANGSPEEALDWRKRASVTFSLYAPADTAYPLRQFKWKEKEVDDAVGYKKGAMFFHYLRGLVGDEPFFAGLREVIKGKGGGFADWGDFEIALEGASGKDLTSVFAEWLDEPGALRFSVLASRDNGAVTLAISQQMPYRTASLDFTGVNNEGKLLAEGAVMMGLSPKAEAFVSSGSGKPLYPEGITFEVDPEWHMLRYIPPAALEPCLNSVLNEKGAVIVYPSGTDEVSAELFKLAEAIRNSGREARVLPDTEFNQDYLTAHSVMILGGSHVNRAWSKLEGALPPSEFTANANSFSFQRRIYAAPEESIVATFANRLSPGRFIAVYHGNSAGAMARARFIFFYGWDSFVLFRGGQVSDRGMFPAAENPWQATLPPIS